LSLEKTPLSGQSWKPSEAEGVGITIEG